MGDIVKAFHDGRFDDIWEPYVQVDCCNYDGSQIDITLINSHHEICFSMDDGSMFIYYPNSGIDKTVELLTFADLNELFEFMKNAVNNPK